MGPYVLWYGFIDVTCCACGRYEDRESFCLISAQTKSVGKMEKT
jgi:hypothetical protein